MLLREIYFSQQDPWKQLSLRLEKHYSPRPSEIVERFKFRSRNRKEDEGVAT